MTQGEIKQKTQEQYNAIETAEQTLKELRLLCKHPNTEQSLYSWRIGAMEQAIICSDCGELVRLIDYPEIIAVEIPPHNPQEAHNGHIFPTEDDTILSANL